MDRILIVVDMQCDFVTGALGSEEAQALTGSIAQRVEWYRENGFPVLFTADTHPASEFDDAFTQEGARIPAHCIKGTAGHKLVPELERIARPGELLEKSSFLSRSLPDKIGALSGGAVVELCGVCTDICVVSNALYLRACYPQNRIVVNAGLCAGTTVQNHKAALAVLRSCLVDVEPA